MGHARAIAGLPAVDIDRVVHPMPGIRPSYHGIFEDSDPAKRVLVVAP